MSVLQRSASRIKPGRRPAAGPLLTTGRGLKNPGPPSYQQVLLGRAAGALGGRPAL
jgi:hypothetical protein